MSREGSPTSSSSFLDVIDQNSVDRIENLTEAEVTAARDFREHVNDVWDLIERSRAAREEAVKYLGKDFKVDPLYSVKARVLIKDEEWLRGCDPGFLYEADDKFKFTLTAIRKGDASQLQFLLDSGFNLNTKAMNGGSAASYGISSRYDAIIAVVLNNKDKISEENWEAIETTLNSLNNSVEEDEQKTWVTKVNSPVLPERGLA